MKLELISTGSNWKQGGVEMEVKIDQMFKSRLRIELQNKSLIIMKINGKDVNY